MIAAASSIATRCAEGLFAFIFWLRGLIFPCPVFGDGVEISGREQAIKRSCLNCAIYISKEANVKKQTQKKQAGPSIDGPAWQKLSKKRNQVDSSREPTFVFTQQ
ncbi:hypothetical protein D6I95_17550 [Alcaligenes faecalis]|nr:hypothetical protein D6I95_17550 [Alcaligenes faecalis]